MRPAAHSELLTQHPVAVRLGRPVALRGPVLANQPARPSLGDAQHALEMRDRAAAACWAHQFPFPSSLSASICSSLSATIRFSRAFSPSSSFSRLAASAFIPP